MTSSESISMVVIGLFTETDCLFHANEHLVNIENQHQVPDM